MANGEAKRESIPVEKLAESYGEYTGKAEEIATAVKVLEAVAARIGASDKTFADSAKEYIEGQGIADTPLGKQILADAIARDKNEKKVILGDSPKASNSVKNNLNGAARFLKAISKKK